MKASLTLGAFALLLVALTLFLTVRVCVLACTATGRGKLLARVSRLWRWEFWPSWLFYVPAMPWLAYLSVRSVGQTQAAQRSFVLTPTLDPGGPGMALYLQY